MAARGGDNELVRETYRADYDLRTCLLPRKPHWVLASPPEQYVKDIFENKGAEVAHQFFLLNQDLPPTEFTVQNLIDYVVKTLFKHPKGTTLPRKWTFIIQLDELSQDLQTWLRTSDSQVLLSESPLERLMLQLVKTEEVYIMKATGDRGTQAADDVLESEPHHEALSAIIKITRQEEVYSLIIEIERPKPQNGETQPSMLNNADGVRSLPTEASVTEHDESEENIEQSSAVREAGHSLGSTTGLVNDAEQLNGLVNTGNNKKRDHHFTVKKPKRQRLEGQYEPTAPATDQPTAIFPNTNSDEVVAAFASKDGGVNSEAESWFTQLRAEVEDQRAGLARDIEVYRKLQEEAKKHNTETAKTLEAAYADISATVDKAESIANPQLLKEVDKRIQQLARVARADFMTEVKGYEARLLDESVARDAQSADDIESRVLAEVKRRVARMTRGIETPVLAKVQTRMAELGNDIEARVLIKLQTHDAELANGIETDVLAKIQTELAAGIEADVLAKVQTRITEVSNEIEAGVLARTQIHSANTAKDIEARVLLKMQAHNAVLSQEVEAGVLSRVHDRIAELAKQVKDRVLAEIDKTSFPDMDENLEEIERYVDMRARVEGAFRAGHDDENGNHGGDKDRDHGSGGEAPARAPHSFEVLGIDSRGAERVRHNGRTYMCPADPDDVLGVERRRHHRFEVLEDSGMISYNGRVFILES